MTVRILLIDDEVPARARMKTLLADIAENFPHRVIGEAADAAAARAAIAEAIPDIVLLDIQMPGMNGVEFAEHLNAMGEAAPTLIFVTAYDQYAVRAFDMRATDYLLKPVRAERLLDALRRASTLLAARRPSIREAENADTDLATRRNQLAVQERGKLLLIPVSEIIFLRAEQKYVTLRTAQGEYLIEESLTALEQEFGDVFVRIHRNTLVACEAIIGLTRGLNPSADPGDGDRLHEAWQVHLRNVDERLPVSRRQWPSVKQLVKQQG